MIGEVLIEFYVSITPAIFAPVSCYRHLNGDTSVQKYPQIIVAKETMEQYKAASDDTTCDATTCSSNEKHGKVVSQHVWHVLLERRAPATMMHTANKGMRKG